MQAGMSAAGPLISEITPHDPQLPRAPVIAVVAEKGGVGKSTVSANIAAWLGRPNLERQKGLRVLAIDAEIQGNLGVMLGALEPEDEELEGVDEADLADAMECAELDFQAKSFTHFEQHFATRPLTATKHENVTLLRGGDKLNEIRYKIGAAGPDGDQWLRIVCEFFGEFFDVIVIDTPPSLNGPLLLGALVAADLAVTPMDATEWMMPRALDKLTLHMEPLGQTAPPIVPIATQVAPRDSWDAVQAAVADLADNALSQATEFARQVVPEKERDGPWLAKVPLYSEIGKANARGIPLAVSRRQGSPAGLAFRAAADRAYVLARHQVEVPQ